MFKPKDVSDSQFNNTTLPRLNETYNGVPKVTSTPLNLHVLTPRRGKMILSPAVSKQITPRRYSLSEASPSTNRTNQTVNAPHSPGPLLASLSFKDNVSMYEETKSSGLARRIVLYNEEAEQEMRPTHQERYNSPGLFPIVHLFKKDPPLLEQSPKRVKIKLSSPEYLINSPQHRSKLLEGITKPSFQRQHSLPPYSQNNETSTKSVLDALKEISRKRMHSNEDEDLVGESGKRAKSELLNGSAATTSKRTRTDSQLLDTSVSPTTKPLQKKFCVYDEFAASRSSSDFSFLNKLEPAKSKRKTISTSTESLTDIKHAKLVNAETQTLNTVNENKPEASVSEKTEIKSAKKQFPIKVFDDAPLERIRRNRLAALMGNLAGKDAALELTPMIKLPFNYKSKESDKQTLEVCNDSNVAENSDEPTVPQEEKPKEQESDPKSKTLTSILSPPKSVRESSPSKSEKHVQFDMLTNATPTFNSPSLTQTSASIVSPIVSDSVSKSPSDTNKTVTEISYPVNSSTESTAKLVSTPNLVPSFSFGNLAASKSESNITTTITTVPSFSIPKFSEPIKSSEKLSDTLQPQKSGGFKFDLKMPSSSSLVAIAKPNATTALSFTTSSLSIPTMSNAVTSSSPAFSFGNVSESKKENTFSFGTNNTATKNNSSEPALGFGGLSKSQPFNFGSSPITTANSRTPSSVGFDVASKMISPKIGNVVNDQLPAAPTFGSLTSSSNNIDSSPFSATMKPNGFGVVIPTFGSPTTATKSFGDRQIADKAPPTFSFGGATSVSTSMFGSKPDAAFGVNTTSAFGDATQTKSENLSFGKSSSTSITFSNTPTTTTTLTLGSNSVVPFGNTQGTKPPVFGSNSVNTSSVFSNVSTGFGATNIPNAPNFKPSTPAISSAFGTNPPAFGSNLTTASSVFGATDTKTTSFGTSNVFGATVPAPSFGNASSTFGAPVIASPFPVPTTTSTSTSFNNAFTSPSTTVFTTSSTFGTNNSAPTFSFGSNKSTIANPFGATTTTTSSTFGTSNVFSTSGSFNSSSGFGSNPPPFGNTTSTPSTFGSTSAPAFGQTENKPTFSFGATETKPNSVFGSGTGNSTFGKPTNTPSGFGSSGATFGSSNTGGFGTQQANGGFNFGTSGAAAAPFAFGTNNSNTEPAKPTFNFTGGANNPPAFGANTAVPTFGGAPPSFGASAPSFPATASPATGIFNIGTGGSASTGRPRTQLRAKRRT